MGHVARKELPPAFVFEVLFAAKERDPSGVIPAFIYTALPHLYVCAGLLTLLLLRNGIAVLSTLAWFSAAAIVWVRRYRYRSPFEGSGGRIDLPTVIDDDGPAEEVVQIYWDASFECGHAVIDAQHRRLFGLSDRLAKALMARRLPGDIAWILDDLVDHVTDHFCTEEAVLAKARHPICREHQAVHRALLARTGELRDRHRRGEIAMAELVGFVVRDVVTDHIAKEAVEFSSLWSRRHSRVKRAGRAAR